MDEQSQIELQRILQLDAETLEPHEKEFLRARRAYLNKRQCRDFRIVLQDLPDVDFGDKPKYDDEDEETQIKGKPSISKMPITDKGPNNPPADVAGNSEGNEPKKQSGLGKVLNVMSNMMGAGDDDHSSDPDYQPDQK